MQKYVLAALLASVTIGAKIPLVKKALDLTTLETYSRDVATIQL